MANIWKKIGKGIKWTLKPLIRGIAYPERPAEEAKPPKPKEETK